MRYRVLLLGLAVPALLLAQQPELPRFRAGTNLVRVDAYVSKDNVALTDLKAADFAVFEDDKPQKIESFELIEARKPNPQTERVDATNVRDMNQQAANATRLFTLFFDRWHVQLAGSYRARKPIVDVLDRVIGPDDMVGVMTPEMSPGAITYSHKTGSIEREITDNWTWGAKNSTYRSPREDAINGCYATTDSARDIAGKMIARLREEETLNALDALVSHLEALRPERKFVMVFTEGWPLFRPDDSLSRSIEGQVPGQDPVRVNPLTGGFTKQGDQDNRTGQAMTYEACERLRTMLAYSDHETVFRQLLQRANRANVSFYPVDARGLIVFDTPIELGVPPYVDQAWMNRRFEDLRTMASQTDGEAVLNATDVSKAMQKIFADVGSYYLLGYYSTNGKLDGRFRRIRVEVQREGVDVRSRPGYLAPTEAEARASGVAIERAGAKAGPPPTVTRALDALAPARGNLPMRVQAVGGRNSIRAVVELDPVTAKLPEWLSGGTLRVTFEAEHMTGVSTPVQSQTVTRSVDPGQRSIVINGSDQPLSPGRYSVRAELTPRNGRSAIQITTFATVPADAAEVGTGGLAARRGPSTGLAYVATADSRFRRTERLRLEVPLAGEGFTGSARLLTRDGQATPLIVSFSERTDEATKQQFGVADVTLAPLAEGEYVIEISLTKGGKTEVITYGFRLVS